MIIQIIYKQLLLLGMNMTQESRAYAPLKILNILNIVYSGAYLT